MATTVRAFTASPAGLTRVSLRRSTRSVIVRAAAEAEKRLESPIVLPSGGDLKPKGLGDVVGMTGPAAEINNGRIAMVSVVTAVLGEITTNKSVGEQLAEQPVLVLMVITFITYASLMPIMLGSNTGEAFGPLTPWVEKINGRAAMLGLTSLILIEAIKGSALL
ncbi:hypothetical protein HXX76_002033 [Chlamydomonas incerta]|uniref:Chloroplast carotenoid-binding protein n=1 Tax=Chlamydomonas incerta TaxID=51695 RepID=Q1WLX7_CHLIN|nr:chloroplast carotenoid-binding protein [Chlamydomonas incerta]KAG2443685.1 hypothetical protein HXX76_002033 [Chlamydomonas incerta]|eukprot:KAG2443685.1 hypothetical protein HXX76_002033 [Chlamydomonas incerta]